MHSKTDSIKLTSYNDANEVVDEVFHSLRSRYQENLETSIRETESIFNSVQLLYYKRHKVIFRRGRSYIHSSD